MLDLCIFMIGASVLFLMIVSGVLSGLTWLALQIRLAIGSITDG